MERPTKRVSDMQLSTEVSAGDYSFPKTINIDVKSRSDSKQFSNPVTFVAQPPPEPQFVYRGRLGTLNQPANNYALLEMNSTKEIKRAKVGDTVMGSWRVDAITADVVELTHTQYSIKKRITLQEKPK